jgi:hypothetical protein
MNSISKCKRTSFQKKCKRTKRAQDVVHQKHNSLHVGYIKLGHLSHKHHQSICLVYALYLYHRINSKISSGNHDSIPKEFSECQKQYQNYHGKAKLSFISRYHRQHQK